MAGRHGRMPTKAAIGAGGTPTILVINEAKTALPFDLAAWIAAAQIYVDQHLAPIWGTPCTLKAGEATGNKIPDGHWAIVFLDDSDQADALGYHDLTPGGFPLSKIFVDTTLKDGEDVSVTASHELAEMLVDPDISMAANVNGASLFYAYEVADAVEEETFKINGLQFSNFVYPAWFESFQKSGVKFDHLGLCKKALQLMPGGYIGVFSKGKWGEIFGSTKAAKKFNHSNHGRHCARKSGVRLPSHHRHAA